MKIGTIGGNFVSSHTKLTHNASSGKTDVNDHYFNLAEGGWVGKSSEEESSPPADTYKWTWTADGQHLGNSTYSFTSTEADDNWVGTGLDFAANTDIGVFMSHNGDSVTNMHGVTTNATSLWDISEEHMFTSGGKARTSGPLDNTVTEDGDYMTFIYSGSQPSPGVTFGSAAQMYWTQAAVTSQGATGGGEYSSVIPVDSYNIEGDIHYITHKVKGTTALIDAGSAQLAWEATTSDPRVIEHVPWGGGQPASMESEVTFRGIILWDSTTTAKGNTGVTFPITTDL